MGIVFRLLHDIPKDEQDALLDLKKRSAAWPFEVYICDDEEEGQRILSEGRPLIGYEPPGSRLSFHYLILGFDGVTREYAHLVYDRANGIPREILRTERCIVREFAMPDMDDLFDLYSEPHITDYIEPLYEYEEEKEYEQNYIRYVYDMRDFGMWLVTDKEGNIIGRMGLEDKGDYEESGLGLGYIVSTKWQCRGIAYEVCSAILEYAIGLGEHRFYCLINPENAASVALATKLGFKRTDVEEGGEYRFVLEV